MPLFHPRVLEKNLKANTIVVSKAHRTLLQSWAKNLAAGNYDKETQNDGEFIQRILIEVLGYVGSSTGSTWNVAKNQPVGSGNVDVALGSFSASGSPVIHAPFELKGAKTKDLDAIMPGRNKSPVQQAWEYAMDAKGAKWVLVSNYREIRMYAVGYGRKDYESFDLTTMGDDANYGRFQLLLSAKNLLSGNTLKLLKDSEAVEKDITKKLYTEYKALRSHLIDDIIAADKHMEPLEAVEISQTILDRVLFIAFAEDKGLLKKDTLKEAFELQNPYSPQPAWDNYKGLFKAIDKGNTKLNIPGYNGGLFANNLAINKLILSDEICKKFAAIGEYDFDSDVSVNILGHIFEQSIADLEEIKRNLNPDEAPPQEVGSKRRTDGIFYTPPFITRHIVEQAVGRWLSDRKSELGFDKLKPLEDADFASIKLITRGKNAGKVSSNPRVQEHIKVWERYRTILSKIKVVDPACGSGAFLNEVFDYLYREGQLINRTLETLYGGQATLFKWDTHILANNIFGVDINKESVEITKLSLWLKTANRNEKLSYLDDNIKAGNSLIKESDIAGDLAFDWKEEFPSVFKSGRFDVVVGNPPYVDSEAMTKAWPRERAYLTEHFSQTCGNWDLYIAFLELGCNLLSSEGYLSFITPDKWISKDFGIEMRKRILPGLRSLLPVGRDVFESALVDSLVTVVGSTPTKELEVLSLEDGEVAVEATIQKKGLHGEAGFDQLLSRHYLILKKIEAASSIKLGSIVEVENACATSDTYVLGEMISDAGSQHGYKKPNHYKVANTGTLSRYVFRWGISPMRYLKADYLYPIVEKQSFKATLGATYRRRAASPKLIVKGLTLLDAALDVDGSYIPGKSTLVVASSDVATLKFLAAVINSKVASFYVKQKYASASYNGGVNFTPDMLNSIPLPAKINRAALVKEVDKILGALTSVAVATGVIHSAVRASCGVGKVGRKLDKWFSLSRTEFVEEVQKRGVKMSIKQKAEWANLFDEQKASVAKNLTALSTAEQAIDSALVAAFGLNAVERAEVA